MTCDFDVSGLDVHRFCCKVKHPTEAAMPSALLPWDDLAEADGYVETDYEGGALDEHELWWRDHQKWLQECGYMLRPRYRPGWVPSWKDKPELFYLFCEDGQLMGVRWRLILLLDGYSLL
jgi:hypothetical protein